MRGWRVIGFGVHSKFDALLIHLAWVLYGFVGSS
jgi:hypothetical protein